MRGLGGALVEGRGGLVGMPFAAPGIPRSVVGPLGFACSRPFRCAKGAWVYRCRAKLDDLQTSDWIIDHGVELLSIVRIAKWMPYTVKGGRRVNQACSPHLDRKERGSESELRQNMTWNH